MRFFLRERGLCSYLLASRSCFLLGWSLSWSNYLTLRVLDLIHSDVQEALYAPGGENKAIQYLIGWQFDLYANSTSLGGKGNGPYTLL